MRNMGQTKIHLGDKVRVVGIPKLTFAPGVKDEMGTRKLFKSMLRRVYTVRVLTKSETLSLSRND